MALKIIQTKDYLLLIDEEDKIKMNDYCVNLDNRISHLPMKVDIRNIGGYGSDKYFWAHKKIIAYRHTLNSEAEDLDLPLLPNPFREVDVEKLAFNYTLPSGFNRTDAGVSIMEAFIAGYKAAQSKQFSLEDMIAFGKKCFYKGFDKSENDDANCFTAWREECSKLTQSLSTQQLPVSFEPEYDLMNEGYNKPEDYPYQECKVLKTIINSEGKEEIVGTYKY